LEDRQIVRRKSATSHEPEHALDERAHVRSLDREIRQRRNTRR
jgi:hypothetical protein